MMDISEKCKFNLYRVSLPDGKQQSVLRVVPDEGISYSEADQTRSYLQNLNIPYCGAVFGDDNYSIIDLAYALRETIPAATCIDRVTAKKFIKILDLAQPSTSPERDFD